MKDEEFVPLWFHHSQSWSCLICQTHSARKVLRPEQLPCKDINNAQELHSSPKPVRALAHYAALHSPVEKHLLINASTTYQMHQCHGIHRAEAAGIRGMWISGPSLGLDFSTHQPLLPHFPWQGPSSCHKPMISKSRSPTGWECRFYQIIRISAHSSTCRGCWHQLLWKSQHQ